MKWKSYLIFWFRVELIFQWKCRYHIMIFWPYFGLKKGTILLLWPYGFFNELLGNRKRKLNQFVTAKFLLLFAWMFWRIFRHWTNKIFGWPTIDFKLLFMGWLKLENKARRYGIKRGKKIFKKTYLLMWLVTQLKNEVWMC